MALLGIDGATSAQGSTQSANNYGYTNSSGFSNTDAQSANANAEAAARQAYERQKELMQMEMEYNSKEAQKQRDWQTEMANSVYTRSINNMREAGINPILAANMGLSAASVGSGATASISGSSAPMAQSFMNTTSAQQSQGEQWGESHGSSWGQSESGLATGLQMMGELIGNAISSLNSSNSVNYYMNTLGEKTKTTWNDLKQLMVENLPNDIVKMLGLNYDASGKGVTRKKTVTGSTTVGNSKEYKRPGTHENGGTHF